MSLAYKRRRKNLKALEQLNELMQRIDVEADQAMERLVDKLRPEIEGIAKSKLGKSEGFVDRYVGFFPELEPGK